MDKLLIKSHKSTKNQSMSFLYEKANFYFLTAIILYWSRAVIADYSLACNPGYRVSAIRRVNSPHQRGKVGSIAIECQQILPSISAKDKVGFWGWNPAPSLDSQVKCEPLDSAPQCNGTVEGCTGSQWIGGFNVYKIHNETNAVLLDPICCSSENLMVDPVSCASERLNLPKLPFEHSILNNDFVYRGLQCWHQYDSDGMALDLIWKLEICQISGKGKTPANDTALIGLAECPPCECHCGINVCGNGDEPIRVVHKSFHPKKCSCDCICRFECI